VHKVQIAPVVIALVLMYAQLQPVNNALRQHSARLGTALTAYVPKFLKANALVVFHALPD